MTQKITTNRTDWTGKPGVVEIDYNTQTFKIEDIDNVFQLRKSSNGVYTIKDDDGRSWTGFDDGDMTCFASCGVAREHKVPQVAFARVMWNL